MTLKKPVIEISLNTLRCGRSSIPMSYYFFNHSFKLYAVKGKKI